MIGPLAAKARGERLGLSAANRLGKTQGFFHKKHVGVGSVTLSETISNDCKLETCFLVIAGRDYEQAIPVNGEGSGEAVGRAGDQCRVGSRQRTEQPYSDGKHIGQNCRFLGRLETRKEKQGWSSAKKRRLDAWQRP